MPETPNQPPPPGKPIDWRTLHLWHIQPLRDVALIVAVLALLYLGYVLRTVTVPILLAMLLAYLFEPLVRWMTKGRAFSRPGAAISIILGLILLVGVPVTLGVGYGVLQGVGSVQQLSSSIAKLVKSVENPDDKLRYQQLPSDVWRKLRDRIVDLKLEAKRRKEMDEGTAPSPAPHPPHPDTDGKLETKPGESPAHTPPTEPAHTEGPAVTHEPSRLSVQAYDLIQQGLEWIEANASSLSKVAIQGSAGAVGALIGALTGIGMFLFTLFLTGFFFFFFCTGYGKVLGFWESLIPERKKGRVIDLVGKMDAVIAGFIRGRLTICAIFIVYFTVAYWIIGVPAWLIMGPLVGVLCLVPYAATLLGMVTVIILMLIQPAHGGFRDSYWWIIGAPVVVHAINQILDDYILSPAIQGKNTGMDTPTILFASLAGGLLAGFYGLLIAIPVAACIKILLKEIVWPQVRAWAAGRVSDPLPLGKS
ncbi:MAG: AI-2E family transporter [Phycisphaerales bacterium]